MKIIVTVPIGSELWALNGTIFDVIELIVDDDAVVPVTREQYTSIGESMSTYNGRLVVFKEEYTLYKEQSKIEVD